MTAVLPYHGAMSNLPPPPPPPPPGRGRGQQKSNKDANSNKSPNNGSGNDLNPDGSTPKGPGTWPKWTIWAMIGVLAAVILVPTL